MICCSFAGVAKVICDYSSLPACSFEGGSGTLLTTSSRTETYPQLLPMMVHTSCFGLPTERFALEFASILVVCRETTCNFSWSSGMWERFKRALRGNSILA